MRWVFFWCVLVDFCWFVFVGSFLLFFFVGLFCRSLLFVCSATNSSKSISGRGRTGFANGASQPSTVGPPTWTIGIVAIVAIRRYDFPPFYRSYFLMLIVFVISKSIYELHNCFCPFIVAADACEPQCATGLPTRAFSIVFSFLSIRHYFLFFRLTFYVMYMYTYVRICVYAYMRICVYAYVCIICRCVYVCARVVLYVSVCMCVCMCYMYMRMWF